MIKVQKRNGNLVPFDADHIKIALRKAFSSTGVNVDESVVNQITEEVQIWDGISVEDIQDEIEELLMDWDYPEVAKAYILYRYSHQLEREDEERLQYMDKYSESSDNAATSSETDGNANVSLKNVANLESEVYKMKNRKIQRRRITKKLKEMFPEVAEQYVEDLEHHILYAHDESSTSVPKFYCQAITLYPLLLDGTSVMDGLGTKPPHNLKSFCGQLINLIFLCSSQCKGAVGVGEFFNFFTHFCELEWGKDFYLHPDTVVTSPACLKQRTIGEEIDQAFQNVVYSICQPAGNRSYQSPFVNFNYFDRFYWHSLFDQFVFPDGDTLSWDAVSFIQKRFMKWFNNERTKTLLTYPVESLCLLSKDGEYMDQEYADFAAEMWSEGHSFFVYTSDNPDAVASCCRLRNEISENTFSSTTGLTGVSTGSCNVITLNINRIVQDWARAFEDRIDYDFFKSHEDRFHNYLIGILERVKKYQITYKTILYEWAKKGMFSCVNAGFIDFHKLFSTTGVNGINEAALFLGLDVSNNEDYKEFVTFILKTIQDFNVANSTSDFMLNVEIVPAEGLGSKNYNWDKQDGYKVPDDRVLYNSYIYDAHDDTSVLDKFVLQGGEIAKASSGGQAIHINLQDHLSKEQYKKLMKHALNVGACYYTFNIPNTQCDHCGKIYKKPLDVCPNCGGHEMTQWTRVIGFLRPIKGFDKFRQIEAAHRTYSKTVD